MGGSPQGAAGAPQSNMQKWGDLFSKGAQTFQQQYGNGQDDGNMSVGQGATQAGKSIIDALAKRKLQSQQKPAPNLFSGGTDAPAPMAPQVGVSA